MTDRQVEYARGIAEAGRRLLFAVDDIHDMAAFATGQASLSPGRVELQTMLGAIVQRAKTRMRDKRLTLSLDAVPTSAPWWPTNRACVRRCIIFSPAPCPIRRPADA